MKFEKFESKKIESYETNFIKGGSNDTGGGTYGGKSYSCDYYNTYSNGDREIIMYMDNGCTTKIKIEL